MSSPTQTTPVELIERRIHVIRDYKVMIDSDLAELYGVATKNLKRRSGATSRGSPRISCSSFRIKRLEI
jgi:hypothetical protein